MATVKQTKTITGTTGNPSLWTWKEVITESWNDDYITTNKSIVKVQAYMGRTSSASYFGGNANLSITCGGQTKSASKTYSYPTNVSAYGWVLMYEETFEIQHDADGTKTITVSSSMSNANFSPTTGSASGSIELTTIPRASSITCPSFNIGDDTLVNIERFSDSFTDTITWSFGSLSGTLATKTSERSIGFRASTYNATNFYNQIPNDTSGRGTITCNTYQGDTLIGTSTCEFTAYVVEDKPTVSASVVDTNQTTINLTGTSAKIIKYISKPKITISATAKKSATISSYGLLTNDGQTSSTRITTLSNGVASRYYTVSATDSRGFSNSVNCTMSNWVEYVKCSFTKKDIYRIESASREIRCNLEGNYYNGSFGSSSNTITLKYRTRIKNGTWSSYTTVSPTLTGNTWKYSGSLGTAFSIDSEYEVEFSLADKLTADSLSTLIQKGLGVVEIGDGLVNINGVLTQNDKYVCSYAIGDLYITTSASNNPNTLYPGTTWQQIKDKFLLACGDTYANGASGGQASHTHTTGDHKLTTSEIPSHSHPQNWISSDGNINAYVANKSGSSGGVYRSSQSAWYNSGKQRVTTDSTGGNGTHNHGATGSASNLPPYLAVYVWKRTA